MTAVLKECEHKDKVDKDDSNRKELIKKSAEIESLKQENKRILEDIFCGEASRYNVQKESLYCQAYEYYLNIYHRVQYPNGNRPNVYDCYTMWKTHLNSNSSLAQQNVFYFTDEAA